MTRWWRCAPSGTAPDDAHGTLKVVMTGSASDPEGWQQHVRTKERREALAERFKDPDDPFEIVIVRDMWLTGFDAPCLHTMYVDKPMRGHGLMQAIARVNRVFRDKPGGLVVDYIGLADQLSRAVKTYSEAGGRGETAIDKNRAVRAFLEKHDICRGIMHGYDWSGWQRGGTERQLEALKGALEHILAQEDGKAPLDAGRARSEQGLCAGGARPACAGAGGRRGLLPAGGRGAEHAHGSRVLWARRARAGHPPTALAGRGRRGRDRHPRGSGT